MKNPRHYSCSDVDMLTSCRTIAGSFAANIGEFKSVRSAWTSEYPAGLIQRIDLTTNTYLGLDARRDQRQATSNVAALQGPAHRDLSFFKTQIEADFKNEPLRRDEILRSLGFTSYFGEVTKGKQESLVQLLYYFKTNMTDTLKAEITGKGLSGELTDRITGYAEAFMQANTAQEQAKGDSHELKAGAIGAFNTIYDEVIAICKIAASYYQYEPLKKALFSFTKVQSGLGGGNRNTGPEPPPKQ